MRTLPLGRDLFTNTPKGGNYHSKALDEGLQFL